MARVAVHWRHPGWTLCGLPVPSFFGVSWPSSPTPPHLLASTVGGHARDSAAEQTPLCLGAGAQLSWKCPENPKRLQDPHTESTAPWHCRGGLCPTVAGHQLIMESPCGVPKPPPWASTFLCADPRQAPQHSGCWRAPWVLGAQQCWGCCVLGESSVHNGLGSCLPSWCLPCPECKHLVALLASGLAAQCQAHVW